MPVRLKRDIHSGNRMERGMEKSAEAVVVRRGKPPRGDSLATVNEGPNLLTQGSIGSTRWTSQIGSKEPVR
jgi:hypothetical protein